VVGIGASAEDLFCCRCLVGCMGAGMGVEHFCGVWASSRTIPRSESFTLCGFVLLCAAIWDVRYMCRDERVQNRCMIMLRIWLASLGEGYGYGVSRRCSTRSLRMR
jgi:hypothetical protein